MQAVARRHLEIIKARRKVYIFKLANGSNGNLRRQPFCFPGLVKLMGPFIGERLDYGQYCNASRDTVKCDNCGFSRLTKQ